MLSAGCWGEVLPSTAECSCPSLWATKHLWSHTAIQITAEWKTLGFSFFSILFYYYSLLCFQEDQLPDPSAVTSSGRDVWQGAEEKAFPMKAGPYRVLCPPYINRRRALNFFSSLKETRVNEEEKPKKVTLQWNSGSPLGHTRKTNQWWDVQSSSQFETIKRGINEQRIDKYVLSTHIFTYLRVMWLPPTANNCMKAHLKRGKLHNTPGNNYSFDGANIIRSSEIHDNWCWDNELFHFCFCLWNVT